MYRSKISPAFVQHRLRVARDLGIEALVRRGAASAVALLRASLGLPRGAETCRNLTVSSLAFYVLARSL
jgi:hypothetical protein